MGFVQQLAEQTAGGAVNAGMGLILGGINDRRQIKQQTKLQNLQIAGQKQMVDYNMMKELQMWKDTNYGPQMDEMTKAGLNPALIYGMKGGGGVTTGSPGAGGVSGAEAPKGGGEAIATMQMGIQSALLKAQEEKLKAETANINADTANKPKTGQNIEANTGLTKINTEIAQIDKEIKGRSTEATIRHIDAQADRMIQEADAMKIQNNINEETWQEQVATIRAELIGVGLKNLSIEAGTTLTTEQAKAIGIKIAQDWKQLELNARNTSTGEKNAITQEQRLAFDKYIRDVRESTKLGVETAADLIRGVLRAAPKTKSTTKEGMKDREGGYWETTKETHR